ncbi:MAG: carboxymuconolactone decarboxylase family protein [Bacteroidota bacterium]
MATEASRKQIEQEMKDHLGLVPTFFKRIPDRFLKSEWQLFRDLELGETHIPNKYKELMGIALHSQTQCRYCTLFHTEAAKLFGATQDEIQEAVHFAKMSTGWSVYLNGSQTDYDLFEEEMDRMGDYIKEHKSEAVH